MTTPKAATDKNHEVVLLSPDDLTIHPSAAALPMLAENDPQFVALVRSIRHRGIDYPILIDEKNRIVEGRHRWRAAVAADWSRVPCEIVIESEVISIIMDNLVARRHYGKGALAYVALPMLKPLMEESRARSLENLKRGNKSPMCTEYTSGTTQVDLARQLGFSVELFHQAKRLHEIFKQHPQIKEIWEPRILMRDGIGLGAAIAGIAGELATRNKPKLAQAEFDLLLQGFNTITKRWSYWDKLQDKSRKQLLHKFGEELTVWPDDVKAFLRKVL